MKKITYVKFGIDILMAVMFVLFFNKRVLGGLSFHEIAGLVFAAVFFTHVLLNWRWVKNVTVKLFNRKLPLKTRFSYLLNVLLLITMGFIIISGIFISRVVFPNINIGNEHWFKISHMSISYLVLILVAIHTGLHWKWVINVFKNIIKLKTPKPILGILAKGLTIAILLFGCYQMYSTHFIMQLQGVENVFNFSSSQMEKGNFNEGERPDFKEGDFNEGERPDFKEGDFNKGERPDFKEGERPFDQSNLPKGGFKGGEGQFNSPNVFSVILTYLSIISVFVIFIYYLEKLIVNKKQKKRVNT